MPIKKVEASVELQLEKKIIRAKKAASKREKAEMLKLEIAEALRVARAHQERDRLRNVNNERGDRH